LIAQLRALGLYLLVFDSAIILLLSFFVKYFLEDGDLVQGYVLKRDIYAGWYQNTCGFACLGTTMTNLSGCSQLTTAIGQPKKQVAHNSTGSTAKNLF